jgi:hypothetical protein
VEIDGVVGVQHTVQVDDDVFDVGFIDAGLAGPPPSIHRRIMVWKDADDVQRIWINEIISLSVGDFSAENQM